MVLVVHALSGVVLVVVQGPYMLYRDTYPLKEGIQVVRNRGLWAFSDTLIIKDQTAPCF